MRLLPEQPQRCKIADVNEVECAYVCKIVSVCGACLCECVCARMCLRRP